MSPPASPSPEQRARVQRTAFILIGIALALSIFWGMHFQRKYGPGGTAAPTPEAAPELAPTPSPTGATTETPPLYTREFRVPPDFFTREISDSEAKAFFNDDKGGGRITDRNPAQDILTAAGVSFDVPGSSATFLPSSSKLVVRHTQQNIDLIESIVARMKEAEPKHNRIMEPAP